MKFHLKIHRVNVFLIRLHSHTNKDKNFKVIPLFSKAWNNYITK